MACTVNTPSVKLTVASGVLSADAIADPAAALPPNPLKINATGIYVAGADGWLALPAVLAYSLTNGNVYDLTVSVDVRSFIGPGAQLRFVHLGITKYAEVVAITASTITVWLGDAATLAAGAITVPFFALRSMPVGWIPLSATTLPKVGYDGQRTRAILDATNGIEWEFVYRAASASTFKWEAVGAGPTLKTFLLTSESTAVPNAGYNDFATPMFLTVPFAGDYDSEGGAGIVSTGTGAAYYLAIKLGAAATSDNNSGQCAPSGGGAHTEARGTGLAAGDTIRLQGKHTFGVGASIVTQNRYLAISPIRCAA
jgi:hypothetical protein